MVDNKLGIRPGRENPLTYTTTDGRVIDVPDICGHCQLDTGGNHEPHCPFYTPWNTRVISDMEINIVILPKEKDKEDP